MILSIMVCCVVTIFAYSIVLAGKAADQRMEKIVEKHFGLKPTKVSEEKMESQREVARIIENEVRKGSAPLRFERLEFTEDTYHLVESQAKLNHLLDYFFRNGEYASLADKQVKSNVYMDTAKKVPSFRSAKSELDRRNMEVSAKRWIKKKQPSFDGDVYVENIRCIFSISEDEAEKRKCVVDGEQTTAMIFSRKHLTALYLQCLINRKEIMQHKGNLEGGSEVCNQIYRLEDVDILFQCLMVDNMEQNDGRLYAQFSTIYLLKK